MSESIIDMLQERGVEVRPHMSSEDEFRICCLFCEDNNESRDEKFRLGFNIRTGAGHCFNCGWSSGNVLLAIIRKLRLEDWSPEMLTRSATKQPPPPVTIPSGFELLENVDATDALFGVARRYTDARGVTIEQLKRHQVGATLSDALFRYRVIFPVLGRGGTLVGIVGRDWTGNQMPKYLNNVGPRHVWNARHDKFAPGLLFLSEGILKAMAVERAIKNQFCSAALGGNSVTDLQLNELRGFEEICLFPDPGKPGVEGFLSVAKRLSSSFAKVSFVWPWPKKQADELPPAEILDLIRGRKKYCLALEWEIRRLPS